jgi:hypothetical protein
VWLYVVLGLFIAISVTFPLFLAARERRLSELGEAPPATTTGDLVGLMIFGAPIVAFALYTLTI